MTPESGTNWLDVLKAAIWPLVALIAIVAFWDPIYSAAEGLKDIRSFKAGRVEISFAVEAARRLPPPDPDVAAALQELTPRDRDALLALGKPRQIAFCSGRAFQAAQATEPFKSDPVLGKASPKEIAGFVALAQTYDRLAALEIIALSQPSRAERPAPKWCLQDYYYGATTDLGERARTYLVELINTSIRISER